MVKVLENVSAKHYFMFFLLTSFYGNVTKKLALKIKAIQIKTIQIIILQIRVDKVILCLHKLIQGFKKLSKVLEMFCINMGKQEVISYVQ